MLICAPTGAGKTNIAMLTVLHEIHQNIQQGVIKKDAFKVFVYFNKDWSVLVMYMLFIQRIGRPFNWHTLKVKPK